MLHTHENDHQGGDAKCANNEASEQIYSRIGISPFRPPEVAFERETCQSHRYAQHRDWANVSNRNISDDMLDNSSE